MKELPTVYPPYYQLPCEPSDHEAEQRAIEQMNVSNDQLRIFIEAYFAAYRSVVDEFFAPLASSLSLYANAPFHTFVVRFGPNGIVVGHRKSEKTVVEVKSFQEFEPPFESPNVIDIIERLKLENSWFDLSARSYSPDEARVQATRDVLTAVLEFLWRSIPDGTAFEKICRDLIATENVYFKTADSATRDVATVDVVADVVLHEPAGFRRLEEWWFDFKHYPTERLSTAFLRQAEELLSKDETSSRILCVVTSDDLTSIGRHLLTENPRIRVWDRTTLNLLANRHLKVLSAYFESYPSAVEELGRRLSAPHQPTRKREFESRLATCPSGRQSFTQFEQLGIEIFQYLFPDDLGSARPQVRTLDGKQRRDVLFRNNRTSRFFDRLFHRFDCDSLIVDFKNYSDEVDSDVVNDVDRYANKALGRFVLVVSRKGQAASSTATQIRIFRDSSTIVLVISDADLVEMVGRRDRALSPEDVLEDKLDEFLAVY